MFFITIYDISIFFSPDGISGGAYLVLFGFRKNYGISEKGSQS